MGHDRVRSAADETHAQLEIRILGPLELFVDGRRADLPGGRALIVLATLARNLGQVVSADRLIDAAWGSEPPASVRTQLQALVAALRMALPPGGGAVIETRHPGYLLDADTDVVDIAAFRRLVAAARSARDAGRPAEATGHFDAALATWRGPAFEGLASAHLEAEAQALHELRLQVFEEHCQVMFDLGRHAEVVAAAERWVHAQPLRESLRALLMLALAGSGRQAEALEVFRKGRDVLVSELGVEPGADLRRLHQRILSGGVGPASAPPAQPAALAEAPAAAPSAARAAVPAQLPADLADFTGRRPELTGLVDLLSAVAPGGPIVISALAGTGGIGKTTLAVHAGHRLRAEFTDGQLYVNLRGTSAAPLTPAEALARFLRALGTEDARIPVDVEERGAAFRSAVAGRRVLVVLDDARDAAQVRPLLPGDPGCGVLVTSRSRLPGLDGCTRLDLDVLSPADAEQMFVRIIEGMRQGGAGAADPESVATILASCAGLPLAIRIAAARLLAQPSWTVATLAAELSDRRHLLDGLQIEDRAVRASFALSHAYLDDEATRAFALLGLWTGPHVPLGAAAALLDRDERRSRRALDALLGAHLLGAPEPHRYRFHDLIGVYAGEQAQASLPADERRAAIGRLVRWYLGAVIAVAALLEPGQRRVDPATPGDYSGVLTDYETAWEWCGRERSNLVAAVELAAESGFDDEAWKIASMVRTYYHRACQWSDWATTHETALAAARRLADPFAEAWVLNNYGILYLRTRRYDEGVAYMRRAEALRKEIGDRSGLATTTSNLGNAYLLIGHSYETPDPEALDAAGDCFAAAVELYREVGDAYGEATSFTNLGTTYSMRGRYDIAAEHIREGLELSRRIGNRPSVAVALHALGELAAVRDDREGAMDYFRQAIEMKQFLGDRHGEAIILKDVADVELKAGDRAAARATLTEASELLLHIDPQEAAALRTRASTLR